jgi:hypothetical protein
MIKHRLPYCWAIYGISAFMGFARDLAQLVARGFLS